MATLASTSGKTNTPKAPTFGHVAAAQMAALMLDGKPSSIASYRARFVHLTAEFGERDITSIDFAGLDAYRARRILAGVSATTIANEIATAIGVGNFAVKRRMIQFNPMKGYVLREPARRRERWPTREELFRLIAAAKTPELRAIIWLLASAGARPQESLKIRREDVDLERGTIRVSATTTKKRRARTILLIPECIDAIRVLPAWKQNLPFIFQSPRGGPYTMVTLWRWWQWTANFTGYDGVLYSCRHACASLMAAAGATTKEIAVHLGHSNEASVKPYVHESESWSSAIRDRVGKIFADKPRLGPKRAAGPARKQAKLAG